VEVRVTITTRQAEHAIFQLGPGGFVSGADGKCVPCGVSWDRPWVSFNEQMPPGPANLKGEHIKVLRPNLPLFY